MSKRTAAIILCLMYVFIILGSAGLGWMFSLRTERKNIIGMSELDSNLYVDGIRVRDAIEFYKKHKKEKENEKRWWVWSYTKDSNNYYVAERYSGDSLQIKRNVRPSYSWPDRCDFEDSISDKDLMKIKRYVEGFAAKVYKKTGYELTHLGTFMRTPKY